MNANKPSRDDQYLNPDCLKTICPGQVYLMKSVVLSIGLPDSKCRMLLSLMMDAWVPHIAGFSLIFGEKHDDYKTLNSLYNRDFLCSKHGFEYRDVDWAETGLPLIIVGDHVVQVAADFGIETVIMQPCHKVHMKMRWVERALHLFSKALVSLTPQDAKRVLILEVIRWNGQVLKRRLVPSDARSAEIRPTPSEIANWGYNRVCGKPRHSIVAGGNDETMRSKNLPPNLARRRCVKDAASSINRTENL